MSSRDTIKRDLSRLALVMGISLWLGVAGDASAAGPWYVAKSGTSGDGLSWATAFTNVQAALNAAQSNDTIYLKGETFVLSDYSLNGKLVWTQSFVTVSGGYAGDGGVPGALTNTPTILANTNAANYATNRVLYVSGVTNGTIRNVTIKGGEVGNQNPQTIGGAWYGGGVYMAACSNMVFDTVTLSLNFCYGQQSQNTFGGGMYALDSVGIMTNCLVQDNAVKQFYGLYAYGGGVHLAGGAWTIRDSVIRGNRGTGDFSYNNVVYGAGLYFNGGIHLVKNCLISRNYGAGNEAKPSLGEGVTVANGTVTIENCTVYWHPYEGIRQAGGTVTVKNSIIWNNNDDLNGAFTLQNNDIEDGDSNGANGNISADPLFERGFYLSGSSPCLNAGSQSVESAGLAAYTTRSDGTADSGQVDLGYHFLSGVQDYYVSVNTGSDVNTGTSPGAGNAFKTIGKALSRAGYGSHIHIEAGHYSTNSETFPLAIDGKSGVQLLGTNASSTVINPAGLSRGLVITHGYPDTLLTGLSITNGYYFGGAAYGAGVYAAESKLSLRDCIISYNRARTESGTWGWGTVGAAGLYATASDGVISNCVFRGNRAFATYSHSYSGGGGGVNLSGNWDVNATEISSNEFNLGVAYGDRVVEGGGLYLNGSITVRNCLITNNWARRTDNSSTYERGDGVYVAGGNVRFENCTVATNAGEGIRQAGGTVGVTNSILWANGDDVAGTMALAYSCIEDGDSVGVNGCISNDPIFFNGSHLPLGSPCVNTGTNQLWMQGGLDLDGTKRIKGGRVDMGAYETVIPLAITNLAATIIDDTHANLNGMLTSDGSAPPANVWVYWGPMDQGMTKNGWAYTNAFGPVQDFTTVSTNITLPGSSLAYRFYVSNAVTEAWSDPAALLTVEAVRLVTTDPNAAESGSEPGVIKAYRTDAATNVPLQVNFTVSGTAIGGKDYPAIGASVMIPVGETNASITITPTPDRLIEGAETVALTLAAGSYVIGTPASVSVTIADWTPPPFICIAPVGANTYGTNWATAHTNLQVALDMAQSNDTIYLKAEVFTLPANSANGLLVWTQSFVTIEGGYAGDDGSPWTLSNTPTILLNTNPAAGNTNRIFYISGVTNGRLANVTIKGGEIGNRNPQTIDGSWQGGGIYMTACTNMVLESVSLDSNYIGGQQSQNAFGFGMYATGSYGILTNCMIRDNTSYGLWTTWQGGGLYLNGGGWQLRDCVVRDNRTILRAEYPGPTHGMGVYINGGTHGIANSLFSRNNGYSSPGLGEGIYIAAGNVTARHVTMSDHPNEGIRLAGGTLAMTNSIIWGNGSSDIVGVPTNGVDYCNIGKGDRAFTFGGNISVNPLFERGFYLAAGSPCGDIGSQSAAAEGLETYTTRAGGEADGGAVDLGYHFQNGVVLPELYVSVTSGDDANSGTSPGAGNALKTIGKALSMAKDGTHINVEAGTYGANTEVFPLSMKSRYGLQLLGTNAAQTIITSAGSTQKALTMQFCYPDAAIANLSVTGVNHRAAAPLYGSALYLTDSKATLSGVVIKDNRAATTAWNDWAVFGGGIYMTRSEGVFLNGLVRGNSATYQSANENGARLGGGVYCDGGWSFLNSEFSCNTNWVSGSFGYSLAGAGLYLGGKNLLRNCLIRDNECNGGGAWINQGDGVYVSAGATVLENCTIVTNGGEGIRQAAGTVAVTNSILWANGDDVTGTVSLAYSDIEDGDSVGVNGCISANPIFVNAAAGNYRLQKTSPCLNAGVNLPWAATGLDLDGTPRIKNKVLDMGAYETVGASGTLILVR